jgi:3-oxoacyl-[acyl-carrier protein] reductase
MTALDQAFALTGRTAIVTGAGSGIGRASAIRMAEMGATVVCADWNGAAAEDTVGLIKLASGSATAATVDVSHRDEVGALVADTVARAGRLDIMGNIAGIIGPPLEVTDVTEEELERVLAVNLKGVVWGCQAAARVMVEQGRGSIINMSSGAIDVPAPGLITYALAKAGVAQLTKTLALEVAPRGVRVNAIAPGLVVTGMTSRHWVRPDGSIDEQARDAALAPMRQRSPMGLLGEPDDIAYAVLYLASDASKFMTGQILRPNGGVAMP